MNDARHMQLCQERAVSERGLRDRFAADRDIHALQQLAVPERTVADRLDALRQHQTAEGNTVRKGTGTDTLDAVAEQNGLQCLISAEQLIRNIPQMRRQPDGFQRRQIAERTDANLRNGIRNDDAAQTLAAGKRAVVNIFRALLEDHLFQRIQRRKSIGRNAVNGARDQQTLNAFARQTAHRSGCNNSIGSGDQQGRIGSDLKQGSRAERQNAGRLREIILHGLVLAFRTEQCFFAEKQHGRGKGPEQLDRLLRRETVRQIYTFKLIASVKSPAAEFRQRRRDRQTLHLTGVFEASCVESMG